MIKSMTGFGHAIGGKAPNRWSVEIRSWNHRFFDCSARLPSALSGLDERVKDFIHSRIKRGKVSVNISLKVRPQFSNGLHVDEDKVRFFIKTLRRIQKKYGFSKEPIQVETLLSIPNLVAVDQKDQTADQFWPGVKRVLDEAMKKLITSKMKEGKALGQDLTKRVGLIERALVQVSEEAKQLPEKRRSRLLERVSELAKNVTIDSGRLEQEVVMFVDRADITEEIVRTQHHLKVFRKSLQAKEATGKKLDFIAQEIHREVNTMASKGQSSHISEEVIGVKSELDKIREQVQNIE
jgi:uncharacterized protein (TIGR00255 family)